MTDVHGMDPSRLRPMELMPIADGSQLAMIDAYTGHVVVVRLDRQGQPVYVSTQ